MKRYLSLIMALIMLLVLVPFSALPIAAIEADTNGATADEIGPAPENAEFQINISVPETYAPYGIIYVTVTVDNITAEKGLHGIECVLTFNECNLSIVDGVMSANPVEIKAFQGFAEWENLCFTDPDDSSAIIISAATKGNSEGYRTAATADGELAFIVAFNVISEGDQSFQINHSTVVGKYIDSDGTVHEYAGAGSKAVIKEGEPDIDSVGLEYALNADGKSYYVKSYVGDDLEVVIPSVHNGCPVTKIGESAFWRTAVTSVVIPDSVTAIGKYAFYGCLELTNVKLSENLAIMGDSAFDDCEKLKSIDLPKSLTAIPYRAFAGCVALESITIHDTVRSIGAGAFAQCRSLTEVYIPDSVKDMFGAAFVLCDNLSVIYCATESMPSTWNNFSDGAIIHWNCNTAKVQSVTENAISGYTSIKVDAVNVDSEKITDSRIDVSKSLLLDIYLEKDGRRIQPNGEVKVEITVPEFINVDNAKLWVLADDGTFTEIEAVYEADKFVFTTKELRCYLVAEYSKYPLGDVNKSESLDMMDYILLKRNYFGTFKFDDEQIKLGDVNKSGAIDMMDYILLKRAYFGTFTLQ